MIKSIYQFFNYSFSGKHRFYFSLLKILGFLPGKIGVYELACVHKSASINTKNGEMINNERLEFLGDAVLGSVIANYLYLKYPSMDEGYLTKMRSKIVNGEQLTHLSHEMGLDQLVVSNTTTQHSKKHLYGDAFEALIGAIYLDKGYYKAQKFIIRKVVKNYLDLKTLETTETNFKSKLIEWAQKSKKEVCFYTDVEPDNSSRFISFVSIGDAIYGAGVGDSKKEAEQNAAAETLEEVGE